MSTEAASIAATQAFPLAAQLPVLQVVAPLIAAPICSLLRVRHLPWALAFAASLFAFACSVMLVIQVRPDTPISYPLGGWLPPFGIEFRVDVVNAFVLMIISAMSVIVLPFARKSIEHEIPAPSHAMFYTLYLLCLAGLLGVTITGDAFNLFVFLEISSLATYVLIAKGEGWDRRALTAAFGYLVMGTIGAAFFVIGIGFLYILTGTLNMADLAVRLDDMGDNRATHVAFAFITIGLGLKAAIFPLHTWLPNAYTYAPSAVTAFLASTATKVSIYALLRFVFTVFGFDLGFERVALDFVALPMGLGAMFIASLVACYQQDLKRMLAYSSVAQIGYMVVGIALSLGSASALTGSIVHLFNHAMMKGAAFICLGCVLYRVGAVSLGGVAGLGRVMPWTAAAFVIAGLSLIGAPGTVGFISKWYLVLGAFEAGRWWIAMAIVLSSLLALVYVWRVIEAMYFRQPATADIREAPLSMLLPAWVLALASIWFGLNAELTGGLAGEAARSLLLGAMS